MSENNLTISYLSAEQIKLSRNKNGFLVLALNDENKGRVKLTRAYPDKMPFSYIGVTDIDDREIGIIKELSELDSDSRALAEEELSLRYYCPVITEIRSVKEKMGSFYFETMLGEKKKNFTVKDISRNIRLSGEDAVLIFDMDGNRYIIPEFEKIEKKSRRLLEPYLY